MDVAKISHIDIRLTLTEANDLCEALEKLVTAYDGESPPRLNNPQENIARTLMMLLGRQV